MPEVNNKKKKASFKATISLQKAEQDVELWYTDECGIERDAPPYSIWAEKGGNPILHYTGSYLKENVVGAVRPSDGKLITFAMPYNNTATFQILLDEIKKRVNRRKINLIILDNARWHITKKLNWGSLIPFFLPPYSPELNPIERIWLHLKKTYFYYFSITERKNFSKAVDESLNFYMNNPALCKSICNGQN